MKHATHAAARHQLPRWLRRTLRAWTRWARWWAGHAPRRHRGAFAWDLAALTDDTLAADGPHADRRCGWFDSSQDLREGLSISEHDAGDTVCAQLPVMAWVQLQLSGWRPELRDSQAGLAG